MIEIQRKVDAEIAGRRLDRACSVLQEAIDRLKAAKMTDAAKLATSSRNMAHNAIRKLRTEAMK